MSSTLTAAQTTTASADSTTLADSTAHDATQPIRPAVGRAAELARAQYQAGLADFQSVLETQRTLLTAQDNLASANADVLTAVIQLYKALGGGWQAEPVTPESEKS